MAGVGIEESRDRSASGGRTRTRGMEGTSPAAGADAAAAEQEGESERNRTRRECSVGEARAVDACLVACWRVGGQVWHANTARHLAGRADGGQGRPAELALLPAPGLASAPELVLVLAPWLELQLAPGPDSETEPEPELPIVPPSAAAVAAYGVPAASPRLPAKRGRRAYTLPSCRPRT